MKSARWKTWLPIAATGLLLSTPALAEAEYSEEGASACLQCHENAKVLSILATPHGDKDDPDAPFAGHQCEACHGPSELHTQFPMQVEGVRFTKGSKATPAERNAVCLECHAEATAPHWRDDPHAVEGLACNSCHKIHVRDDPFLHETTQPGACESCHTGISGPAQQKSLHPVAGGEVTCTDCHRPHMAFSFESCISCHPMTPEALARQEPRARSFHESTSANEVPCTSCHKGVAHGMPPVAAPEVQRDDPHEF